MSTVLISLFDADEQASKGVAVLKEMQSRGAVAAMAMVRRDNSNRVTVDGSELPQGAKPMVVGLLAGTLVGLLLGPMGAAVGGVIGVTGGISRMASDGDSASAFLDEVAQRIAPGTSAVIAELSGEIDEKLGDSLRELGAALFVTTRDAIQNTLERNQLGQIIADEQRRREQAQ